MFAAGLFGWMPGADLDSMAEREIKDLNAQRTGSKDKVGAFNWQDQFGLWLNGATKEQVLDRAKEIADQQILEQIQPTLTRQQGKLGHLKPEFQGVDSVSLPEIKAQLAADAERIKALEKLKATNPKANIQDISPTASAGDIGAVGIRATTKASEAKEEATIKRQEGYAETARQDRLRQEAWQRHQSEEAQRYREFEAAESRKERMRQRADNKELALIKLAEGKADRAYQRGAEERAALRADKKDRQLAIMQLMKGLSQMGYSMSI